MKSLLTLLTFCVCTIPNLLSAATCIWTGGGGNGNWDEPSKWSCLTVPGPGDDVIIATGTNVTRNSSVTVQSLLLQNAGAALTVTGDLTITGLLTWEAGTIAGAGSLICNGGALFQTSSTKTLEDKDLQLNAASTWSGGMIVVPQALPITVGIGVQWEITGSDILRPVLGNTGELVNNGTILKSGGLQTTFEVVDFTNTGTVTVNASILEVRGCNSTGHFTIGPNATLKHYQNAFDLQAGASISGAGAFMIGTAGPSCTIHPGASLSSSVIVNGGTLQLDANATIPDLELGTLSSSTVTGAGQLVVTGVTGWNGGSFLNMPAGVHIQGTADLGGSLKTVENCQVDMTGLTTWRDGQIRLGAQGSMIIKCIFDTLVADRNVQQFPTNAPGALFELTGPYLKLGPGTTQINTPFVNNGNVEVHLGNLELEEGESNGDILLSPGTSLRKVGASTTTFLINSGTVSGAGGLDVVGGKLEVLAADVDTDVELGGGQVIWCFPDTIGALTLGGGTLETNSPLYVTELLSVLSGGNTLKGGGSIEALGGTTINSSSGTTLNDLTLNLYSATNWINGNFRMETNAVVNNKSGQLLSVSTLTNRNLNAPGAFSGQAFNNEGTVRNLAGSRITFTSNLSVANLGSIEGLGIYDFGAPLTNAGTFSPGLSPGTMTLVGTIVNNNILNFELQDNAGTVELDELPIRGNFTAGGTLNVTVAGNIPAGTYPLIFCDSLPNCLSGTFAATSTPPGTSIQYTPNSINLVVAVALPVELTDFSARVVDQYNLLEWSTQLEFHSSEFRIERSLDGNVFSKIGSLPAQGDSYVPTEYFFCDYSAPISAYYRLKMVDLDGTFRYSPVVYVEREDMLVHLYPNPCSQWLELEMAEPLQIAEYLIHDRRGALVGKGLFYGQSLDLTGLPDGVYTICLLDRSRQLAHRATISKVE